MSGRYRARHHKYFVIEDARDQVLQRHQAAGVGDASRVPSAAIEQIVATDDHFTVPPIMAKLAAVVPPDAPTEKPYVAIVQPGRRARALPGSVVPPVAATPTVTDADRQIFNEIEAEINATLADPAVTPAAISAMPQLPPEPEQAPEPDPTLETLPIGHHDFEYLCGTAGTGKTWLARKLFELSKPGSVVIAATTGIAAVNLGEGTTINALLGFFNTDDLQEKFQTGQLQATLRRHRKAGLRRIILDEVSMMDGRQLTMITRAIVEVNQPRDRALESMGQGADAYDDAEEIAGELPPQLGITLVGDFAQLSPVPDKKPDGTPIPMTYAFESPEWPRYAAHVTKLTRVRRQDAQDFVHALHAIRRGAIFSALKFFTADRFVQTTDMTFEGTTIFAKNAEVDRHNQLRLDTLTTPRVEAEAVRWGTQRGDWKQIPDRLVLKEGALVMVLANRRSIESRRLIYANGDLGTLIKQQAPGCWLVQLKRNGETVPVTLQERQNQIPMQPGRRKEIKEYEARQQDLGQVREDLAEQLRTGQLPDDAARDAARRRIEQIDRELKLPRPCGFISEDGKYEIIGTIVYMPLRCAYAATVHKCLLAGTRVVVVGRGLIPVEDVRVNDVVLTGQGHQARVKAAQPTGTKELVTVKFASGRHLHMSPDHPLQTAAGPFTHAAKVGDRIRIAQQRDVLEWDTPLPAVHQTPRGRHVGVPRYLKPELAWWLGAVLGDGSVRDRRDGTIEFHAREPEIVERFCGATRTLFGLTPRKYPKHVAVISKALRQWLIDLGVDYVTSENKRVPECIFRSSHASRAAFIQGLFDTDGCVDSKGYIRYVTTSQRLAEDVQTILDSLGVRESLIRSQIPTVMHRGVRRQGHRAYTVRIGSKGTIKFLETVQFSHAAKQARLIAATKQRVRHLPNNADSGTIDTIVEVVRTGLEVPLHDLEVDHDDHSFIANGLVVSNTQGLTLDLVQVNLRDPFFKYPGMTFVALSRCRTAEGLRIVGNPTALMERMKTDPRVLPWL